MSNSLVLAADYTDLHGLEFLGESQLRHPYHLLRVIFENAHVVGFSYRVYR